MKVQRTRGMQWEKTIVCVWFSHNDLSKLDDDPFDLVAKNIRDQLATCCSFHYRQLILYSASCCTHNFQFEYHFGSAHTIVNDHVHDYAYFNVLILTCTGIHIHRSRGRFVQILCGIYAMVGIKSAKFSCQLK